MLSPRNFEATQLACEVKHGYVRMSVDALVRQHEAAKEDAAEFRRQVITHQRRHSKLQARLVETSRALSESRLQERKAKKDARNGTGEGLTPEAMSVECERWRKELMEAVEDAEKSASGIVEDVQRIEDRMQKSCQQLRKDLDVAEAQASKGVDDVVDNKPCQCASYLEQLEQQDAVMKAMKIENGPLAAECEDLRRKLIKEKEGRQVAELANASSREPLTEECAELQRQLAVEQAGRRDAEMAIVAAGEVLTAECEVLRQKLAVAQEAREAAAKSIDAATQPLMAECAELRQKLALEQHCRHAAEMATVATSEPLAAECAELRQKLALEQEGREAAELACATERDPLLAEIAELRQTLTLEREGRQAVESAMTVAKEHLAAECVELRQKLALEQEQRVAMKEHGLKLEHVRHELAVEQEGRRAAEQAVASAEERLAAEHTECTGLRQKLVLEQEARHTAELASVEDKEALSTECTELRQKLCLEQEGRDAAAVATIAAQEALATECKELRRKLVASQGAESECVQLKQQLAATRQAVVDAQNAADEVLAKDKQSTSECARLQKELEHLTNAYNMALNASEDALSQGERLGSEVQRLQAELVDEREVAAQLREKLASVAGGHHEEQQLAEEKHQAALGRLQEQMACAKSSVSKATRMATEAQESEHAQRQEYEKLIDKLACAKASERAAYEAKESLSNDMQRVQQAYDELRIKFAVAEDESRNAKLRADEKIAALENKCEDLQGEVANLQKSQPAGHRQAEFPDFTATASSQGDGITRVPSVEDLASEESVSEQSSCPRDSTPPLQRQQSLRHGAREPSVSLRRTSSAPEESLPAAAVSVQGGRMPEQVVRQQSQLPWAALGARARSASPPSVGREIRTRHVAHHVPAAPPGASVAQEVGAGSQQQQQPQQQPKNPVRVFGSMSVVPCPPTAGYVSPRAPPPPLAGHAAPSPRMLVSAALPGDGTPSCPRPSGGSVNLPGFSGIQVSPPQRHRLARQSSATLAGATGCSVVVKMSASTPTAVQQQAANVPVVPQEDPKLRRSSLPSAANLQAARCTAPPAPVTVQPMARGRLPPAAPQQPLHSGTPILQSRTTVSPRW